MSTYFPDSRGSSSTSVLLPQSGEATSRLRKLCDCTRVLAQLTGRTPQAWLDEAAIELAQAFGAEVGVYLLLGRWDAERRRWRLLASAQNPNAFEVLSRCGAVLLERWPDDEYSLAAGHAAYPPKAGMGRLPDLVAPQVWERCAYRRLRLNHGLAGAARWLGRTCNEDVSEVLLVQLEDPRHADGPSDEVLEELAALAPQLLTAYQDAFLLPELRRVKLLERLTPAQQRVAQLLLQGLSQIDIAKQLGRKYHTVRGHVKGIYERLGVHSRDEFAQVLGCPLPLDDDDEFEAVESTFDCP
jgi:DNA-binding CsgD family transcriptional regulator